MTNNILEKFAGYESYMTGEFVKHFPVFSSIPEGWRVDEGVLTCPVLYTAITNGRSRFDKQNPHLIAIIPQEVQQ